MDGEGVQYTVKELLAQVGKQLDEMDSKLDTLVSRIDLKAERAALDALRAEFETVRMTQIAAAPVKTRDDLEVHIRQPHSVASHHEERIVSLEKWKYSIPPAIVMALISAVVAIWKAG